MTKCERSSFHTNYGDGRTVIAGKAQRLGAYLVSDMATPTADLRWKVGATEKTVSGRNWRHGFGFSMKDFGALFSSRFLTRPRGKLGSGGGHSQGHRAGDRYQKGLGLAIYSGSMGASGVDHRFDGRVGA
jgi:hypothetical protein